MVSFKMELPCDSKLPEKKGFEIKIASIKEAEENDNPIEEVRLTVPITDDPNELTLTFRTWFLGITSCIFLSFVNQFFAFRQNQLSISSVPAQIVTLPLGRLMAASLPTKQIRIPHTDWSFSFNPGPFTMKEHVLITIFSSSGTGGIYAVGIITIILAFYQRGLNPVAAMLLAQTTQLLGYGWAGIFRKVLVESPYMWWPANLVFVSLFRTLHDKENRKKGGLTKLQFFTIVFVSSFSYYTIPGLLFPSLSAISFLCWIWKDSITMQQIGSGKNGLGIGSFGLDWSTVAGFMGSPLATPCFAIANAMAGFFLFIYVLLPIAYWSNFRNARRFPFFSAGTFDSDGQRYNLSRILNTKTFDINIPEYEQYSQLHLSVLFAFIYGISFASLAATISHVALFEGKTIWRMWRKATTDTEDQCNDVHTRLMKKNYEAVPQWWFIAVLAVSLALALFAVEGFDKQLQLPWWGLLLACGIALIFTLPVGVIQATTNMQVGLNVITELVIGYMYPGKPLANVTFKTYGYVSMQQALSFLGDFKLGHYMKIPPKDMFIVQLAGTIVASTVYFCTAWWLLKSVDNICNIDALPKGSPWTCPSASVFYSASIIWGVVGPLRMFTKQGLYPEQNWFFLVGLLAPVPVWILSRYYPKKKWIKLIHMPLILGGTAGLPAATSVNYLSWGAVGIFFNFYIYRRYKTWWARHTYILSAALDAGVAFMAILLYLTLQSHNVYSPDWWGSQASDHCPLANCPTAPGIHARGCPVLGKD